MPQAAIVDPAAEGLPDLDQLPHATPDTDDFKDKASEYWDGEGHVPDSNLSRRGAQRQRLTASLTAEAHARVEAGLLSPQGKRVVDDALERDDDASHNMYTLRIGSEDGDSPRTGSLNGLIIMTEKPLGYSYQARTVEDRLDRASATVLYMPGRDGTLREFPNAKQAFDWVSEQLRSNPAFKEALLARQTPQNQNTLSQVADSPNRDRLYVLADLMPGNPADAVVNNQIQTWNTSTLSKSAGAWSPARGLDVSRSDESRMLEVENSNNQLIRDRLPPRLKNLQLTEADKRTLQSLMQDSQTQQSISQSYYGDVPDFSRYADSEIKARIRTDKGVDVDPSQITVTVPVHTTIPGSTHESFQTIEHDETYSLTELVAQQYLNTAPLTWDLSHVTVSGSGADKLDRTYVQTLSDTLDLEENYTKLVHKTFDRPADPAGAAAFDVGQAAAKKASTATMKIDALIARRSGALSDHDYQMVQDVIDYPDGTTRPADADGKTTRAYGLALNGGNGREGSSLSDVTLFAHDGESNIVVYTPHAPDGKTFRAYASRSAFTADLRQQLASIKEENPDKWGPMAQYWAGQSGAQKLQDNLPWLRQVANGKGGSDLNTVRIDNDFFQSQYDYRVRHLLADADASARTDNEVTQENTLSYAHAAYQVAQFFLPNFITVPLALSDIASSLFQSYRAYNQSDKEGATNALFDALTHASSVPFDMVGGGWYKGRVPRPIVASSKGLGFQPRPVPSADTSGYTPLPDDSRYAGLYVKDAKLYAKLDGRYNEAYVDKQTRAVHLGDPSTAKTGFYKDPELRRDVDGSWTPIERPGLKGGNPSDGDAPPYKIFQTPGQDVPLMRMVSYQIMKGEFPGPKKDGPLPFSVIADMPSNPGSAAYRAQESAKNLYVRGRSELPVIEQKMRATKPTSSDLPMSDSDALLDGIFKRSDGLVVGEDHRLFAAKKFLIDHMDELRRAGVKRLYLENFTDVRKAEIDNIVQLHRSGNIDATPAHPTYSDYELVEAAVRNGITPIPADVIAAKMGDGSPSGRLWCSNYYMQSMINADQAQPNSGKWVALVGNAHVGTTTSESHIQGLQVVPGLANTTNAIGMRTYSGKDVVGDPTVSQDTGRTMSAPEGEQLYTRSDLLLRLPLV